MLVYTHCLSIAGSDPSGGAGIQADIKVFSALGCYASAAITALTVQNTLGVKAAYNVKPDLVAAQIETVFEDRIPDAIKIGMTGDAAIVRAITGVLRQLDERPFIVIDPVMISSSNHQLLDDNGIEAIMTDLAPLCDIITPNIHEFYRLCSTQTKDSTAVLAQKLFANIADIPYLLVKGGHSEGLPTDILYSRDGNYNEIVGQWVVTNNTHGTGCALSSAIAANMAKLLPPQNRQPLSKQQTFVGKKSVSYTFNELVTACKNAKQYVSKALSCGAEVQNGQGNGAMNHLFQPEELRISNI